MVASTRRALANFALPLAAACCCIPPSLADSTPPLRFSTYITVDDTAELAADPVARDAALALLREYGIEKVYIEVSRGNRLTPAALKTVNDYFLSQGFLTAGGIATVPGPDFGVRQRGGYDWFNWQAEKTQHDIAAVMRESAPVFSEFIVDDFLCTDDRSPDSDAARRGRDWETYRRDLLTGLQQAILIGPAREANPDITMIIKYPQWYDLFHRFGYDVERETQLYDRVYVGTETRGEQTRRFGFTPPYMGFINYRWLAEIAGPKISGAWFDHLDCTAHDYLDQAWQSVLAGAPELIFFSFNAIQAHEPGLASVHASRGALATLSEVVRQFPVVGIPAFKPPISEAHGDLFLLDFLGMLGIPLVPVIHFPENADTLFLPTHAAALPDLPAKIEAALRKGKTVILTAGLLARFGHTDLHHVAGLAAPVQHAPFRATTLMINGTPQNFEDGLDCAAAISPGNAKVLLEVLQDGQRIPFLTSRRAGKGTLVLLNVQTYTQADYDAVGEVLLAPRKLGLRTLPREWVNTLRKTFLQNMPYTLDAPAGVTFQPLRNGDLVLQNYNEEAAEISLETSRKNAYRGAFDLPARRKHTLPLPPRSHQWLRILSP